LKKDKLLNPLKPITLKGNAIPDWLCDDFFFLLLVALKTCMGRSHWVPPVCSWVWWRMASSRQQHSYARLYCSDVSI